MRVAKTRRVQVSIGWQNAGRKGYHIVTIEYHGRIWHVVEFDGDNVPIVISNGSIELVKSARDTRPDGEIAVLHTYPPE